MIIFYDYLIQSCSEQRISHTMYMTPCTVRIAESISYTWYSEVKDYIVFSNNIWPWTVPLKHSLTPSNRVTLVPAEDRGHTPSDAQNKSTPTRGDGTI